MLRRRARSGPQLSSIGSAWILLWKTHNESSLRGTMSREAFSISPSWFLQAEQMDIVLAVLRLIQGAMRDGDPDGVPDPEHAEARQCQPGRVARPGRSRSWASRSDGM